MERNAQAVMSGNFAQLMSDITPEALGKLMQMMPASGQVSLTSLPAITGYDITEADPDGETAVYTVTFHSERGDVTLASHWRQVVGQWKISDFSLVDFNLQPGPA